MTGLDRDMAKATNFAKIFGAGVKKFAEMIGKPLSEAQLVYGQYDSRLPFVWQLSRSVQAEANRLGYTVLYGGARRHWNLWEAACSPTPRAPRRARAKRRCDAGWIPRIPGSTARCSAARSTPPSTR